jgi:hypothetical protein
LELTEMLDGEGFYLLGGEGYTTFSGIPGKVSWSTLSEDTLFELQNSGVLTYLAAQPPVRELFEQLAATHPPFISPTARSVFQRALNASSRTSMQSAQRP